jgi:rod shape-determining protein MreC
MNSLLSSRQARRRGLLFAILMAITLLLMAFSANPYVREFQNGVSFALRPMQGALAGVADNVNGVVSAITEIDTLRLDNAALKAENERLTNENARLAEVKRENDQLTALLQLQSGFDHATVAARVIGRDPIENRKMVTLDKGTDDGIKVGDVVIVQGGAVAGRVTDIGPNFAKVTLISDGSSTVIGQLATSGATGEIVGQTGDVLIMRNIDAAVDVTEGEEVYTAGLELNGGVRSAYPKGLVVGSVVDGEASANAVVQTAFLAPAANLDSFELALIITDYQGGLPALDEQAVPCGTSGDIPAGEVPCYTPLPTQGASSAP